MAFDSSTLSARTSAGEAELATPSQGLSLGQRRVLTLLENPIAVEELAQQHRLEPEKLARDLTRLAELRLVVLQGPAFSSAPPRASVPTSPASRTATSMAPVVIGRGTRRASALPLLGGVAAVVLAAGIWYVTRGSPTPAEAAQPNAAAPGPAPTQAALAPAPAPTPPAVDTANAVALTPSPIPATAVVLRDGAAPAAVRPQNRDTAASAASATTSIQVAPSPKAAQRPETTDMGAAPTPSTVAASPPAPPPTAMTPSPAPAPAADAAPPVQLASAAPASAAPRPVGPLAAALKPISREPPDFPKEAIADGYKSGVVTARIHVDARGSVTGVDIVAAQPPKVFDRAVRRALLRWQFEPNAAGQSADLDVDVNFQRD